MMRVESMALIAAVLLAGMVVSCATASSSSQGGMSRQGNAATARATEDLMDDIMRQTARDTAMRSARMAARPR